MNVALRRVLPEAATRAVTVDGRLVGSIASFVVDGDTEEIEETILRLDEPARSAPPDASSGDSPLP